MAASRQDPLCTDPRRRICARRFADVDDHPFINLDDDLNDDGKQTCNGALLAYGVCGTASRAVDGALGAEVPQPTYLSTFYVFVRAGMRRPEILLVVARFELESSPKLCKSILKTTVMNLASLESSGVASRFIAAVFRRLSESK